MNTPFESLNSLLYEFNDVETPPDLTVRPAPAALLRRLFRQMLFPEKAWGRRSDVGELLDTAREEYDACLREKDAAGASFCLSNLVMLTKVRGEVGHALQLAEEAQQLATQVGLADLAAQMRAARDDLAGRRTGSEPA